MITIDMICINCYDHTEMYDYKCFCVEKCNEKNYKNIRSCISMIITENMNNMIYDIREIRK